MDFEHFMRNSVKFSMLYLNTGSEGWALSLLPRGFSPSLCLAYALIKHVKTLKKKNE